MKNIFPFSQMPYDGRDYLESGVGFQVKNWGEKSRGNPPWPRVKGRKGQSQANLSRCTKGAGISVRKTQKADPGERPVNLCVAEAFKSLVVVFPELPCIIVKYSMA